MGAIEELQRDCVYCRQPITLKWKSGPMPSEGARPSPAAQPDPVAIGRNQGCTEHWEGNAYENFSGGEQR
jgi:hypothetical protein